MTIPVGFRFCTPAPVLKAWEKPIRCRLKNKQPEMTVGCLIEPSNAEAQIDGVNEIVYADEPKKALDQFKITLEEALADRPSAKNLAGRDLGSMKTTAFVEFCR